MRIGPYELASIEDSWFALDGGIGLALRALLIDDHGLKTGDITDVLLTHL